jgi:hypothetical protein
MPPYLHTWYNYHQQEQIERTAYTAEESHDLHTLQFCCPLTLRGSSNV